MLNLLRGNKKMDFYKSLQLEFFRPYATDTGFQLKAGVDDGTAWWRWWLTRHTMARATAVEVTSPSAIAQKVRKSSMKTLPKALISALYSYGPCE